MHYLYRHIRLDKNEPFYIGIGTIGNNADTYDKSYRRAYIVKKRSKLWEKVINKTEYEVEIVLESDDYDFIKQKEIEFIKLYGRIDIQTGTLVNMTEGGDGTLGYRYTREQKEKRIRQIIKNKKQEVLNKSFPSKNHGDIKIINYINNEDVTGVFINTGNIINTSLYELRRGILKDVFSRTVRGVGYLGGKVENRKAYTTWGTLLKRNINNVGVDERWHNFQNFAEWFEKNYIEGNNLYTNLLSDDKEPCYEHNSYFLPHSIFAVITTDSKGYHIKKGGYISSQFRMKHIGYFNTVEEAIEAYKEYKNKYFQQVLEENRHLISKETFKILKAHIF